MLSNYVPSFLCNSSILKNLYKNQQSEIDIINSDITDLINQCFVGTATWGLSIWEEELGIVTNTQRTYEERRNKILAKLRVQAPTTKACIKNIAEIFAETTNVIQHNEEYWFEINLETHSGFTNFLDDLMEVIEDLKPAHLGVKHKLTSNKDYKLTSYVASTLVNTRCYQLSSDFNYNYSPEGNNNTASKLVDTKYYQLTNDFNINYLSENSSKIASNIVNTNNYVLTNNINEDSELNANLVQASTQVNTSKYELY